MIPIRCGTCGTDNAPGSRFCGGCGARLDASGPVTVPPASSGPAVGPPSGPIAVGPVGPPSVPPGAVGMAPASVPPVPGLAPSMAIVPPVSVNRPTSVPTPVIAVAAPSTVRPVPAGPKSVPPGSSAPRAKPGTGTSTPDSVPPAVRRRASERLNSGGNPQLSSGSVIGAAPGRRRVPWLLLVIDLAMIVGGGLLLRAALQRGEAPVAARTEVTPMPGTPTPTPTQTPAAEPAAGSGSSAAVPASAPSAGKSADVKATLRGSMKGGGGGGDLLSGISKGSGSGSSNGNGSGNGSGSGSGNGNGSSAATVDPYPVDAEPVDVELATQVDRQSAKSQAMFERCYTQATKALPADQPLVGDVELAFQVLATGETRNAAVVNDTTGSAELGRCLLAVVATWQFTTGGAGPTDFVRPFHFSGK